MTDSTDARQKGLVAADRQARSLRDLPEAHDVPAPLGGLWPAAQSLPPADLLEPRPAALRHGPGGRGGRSPPPPRRAVSAARRAEPVGALRDPANPPGPRGPFARRENPRERPRGSPGRRRRAEVVGVLPRGRHEGEEAEPAPGRRHRARDDAPDARAAPDRSGFGGEVGAGAAVGRLHGPGKARAPGLEAAGLGVDGSGAPRPVADPRHSGRARPIRRRADGRRHPPFPGASRESPEGSDARLLPRARGRHGRDLEAHRAPDPGLRLLDESALAIPPGLSRELDARDHRRRCGGSRGRRRGGESERCGADRAPGPDRQAARLAPLGCGRGPEGSCVGAGRPRRRAALRSSRASRSISKSRRAPRRRSSSRRPRIVSGSGAGKRRSSRLSFRRGRARRSRSTAER